MDEEFGSARQVREHLNISEEEWLYFLLDEGLEVLAAYRAITDSAVRRIFLDGMKDAGARARNIGVKSN